MFSSFCPFTWLLTMQGGIGLDMLEAVRSKIGQLISTFRFFPAFLLLGLLSYTTGRWRESLVNAHTIQARIHDIGAAVGGAVIRVDLPTRKVLYRLYRYLNTVHALTYQSVHPRLPRELAGFIPLGLLTPMEVTLLLPMQNKVRDTLIAWTQATIEQLVQERCIRHTAVGNMMIPGLRGICARHHDLFVRNMPNVWFAVAKLLVDYLVVVQIFSLASESQGDVLEEADISLRHRRLFLLTLSTFCTAWLVSSAYWLPWSIVKLLENPWDSEVDSYNCDALMGSSERMLFATLRSRFDADALDAELDADLESRGNPLERFFAALQSRPQSRSDKNALNDELEASEDTMAVPSESAPSAGDTPVMSLGVSATKAQTQTKVQTRSASSASSRPDALSA